MMTIGSKKVDTSIPEVPLLILPPTKADQAGKGIMIAKISDRKIKKVVKDILPKEKK